MKSLLKGDLRLQLSLFLCMLFGLTAFGQVGKPRQHDNRNFDARSAQGAFMQVQPGEAQRQAVDYFKTQVPSLTTRFDQQTGVTRVLYNRGGYLSMPSDKFNALDLAVGFVNSNATLLGINSTDLQEYMVKDNVFSDVTGATHIYLQQVSGGLPVFNGLLHVNVNRDGRIISVNNSYLGGLANALNTRTPSLDAVDALLKAAAQVGLKSDSKPVVESRPEGIQQMTTISAPNLAREPVVARLIIVPVRQGMARLAWNFRLATRDSQHVYDFTVDAVNGQIWTRFDEVVSENYLVYEEPNESPIHATPAPPADARTNRTIPNPASSPLGWHDTGTTSYTTTQGNNVKAYEDGNNSNSGTGPDCGASLDCSFASDLNNDPDTYEDAAVANLFYWNNIIHDVTYVYGFNEAGGNFQTNNFGNGGAGNDEVQAEAQDGGGTNNANFATPSDGNRPRMQMYLWNQTTPRRDGDYDNGIIVHEYGHGISNRLVGGPNSVGCLGNSQQPGEGLSDWWALFMTHEPGDAGSDARGIGTYALGEPVTGPGIRTQRYSTDPAINTHTYQSIRNMVVPHGVGEVWAQIAWECYWALVDTYGFDANLYDPLGGAGNQRMMLYVIEGLKNTACSPTFADVRDGIIQAATDNYGGADVCILWDTFAAIGLGVDADDATSNSNQVTDGFSTAPECLCNPQPVADAGPSATICLGDPITIGTPATGTNTYSWSPGGATTAQITVSPTVTTTYTITATTVCGSNTDSVTIVVDNGSGGGINDDLEGDTSGWTTTGLWHLTNNSTCATPGYSSATHAFYYGQDTGCTYNTGSATSGSLTSGVIGGINTSSTLSFDYYRVVESYSGAYDKTEVDVLTSSGSTTVFALDSSTASTAGWVNSGNISLAAFAGQTIQLVFRFDSVDGVSNAFTGWMVDDIVVTAESNCTGTNTPPTVTITAPADGTSVVDGTSITFTGTANDAEDGDISASISWSSSLDGALGSGASTTATLSVGTHTVSASATDSGSLSGSDAITVTVTGIPNTAPVVTITAPADGTSVSDGTSITFTGTANDAEDGDISAGISWSSSLDGALGTGASTSATLSVGTHTIAASATDSGSLSGSDAITVTVTGIPNTAPVVTITAPADGTSVSDGTSITFTGTANDAEDGDISTGISWSSSLDGALGTGASTSATLSVGTHTISASATDSGSLSGSDAITVTVTPVNPGWVELTNDNFESGWGAWSDGGTDCRRSANDAQHAHQGTYCVRLRDNSGAASAMAHTNGIDLAGPSYTELRINFWYKAVSFEGVEDFFVEVWDGAAWQVVANYVRTIDFNNNEFHNPEIIVNSGAINFASDAKVRIRADASGNGDRLYIDEVVVSARQ